MKTKITFLAAIFMIASFASFATVRTVSNHPQGGAQYSSLQAAYDASAPGDTLLIEGTANNYLISTCNQNWSKSLTVIGEGFNTAKENFMRTRIAATYCQWSFVITGSNIKFIGIHFVQPVSFNGALSNVIFEECLFDQYLECNHNNVTGIEIRNCIFDKNNDYNINLPGYTVDYSITIMNCIFDGYIQGSNNVYGVALVDHCIFLRNNGDSFISMKNVSTISNCIFMNTTSITYNSANCLFINNISRLAVTFPPAGCSGSGNMSNTDPNFVNYALNSHYSTAWDFHLQSGSPAVGAGSDATDIGVHGGTSKFSESGEPLVVPIVRSVQINNTMVAPNGTLNVDVSASKPTDE